MKVINLTDLEKSEIKYKISKFPDGQQNIVINKDNCIGGEFILTHEECVVQIKSRLNNWLDLELIVCTVASLREIQVKEIHLYTPYIMGARSDRKFEEGGNNYLRDVIAPIINSLGFKSVTVLDPHSDCLEMAIQSPTGYLRDKSRYKKISNLELVKFTIRDLCGFTHGRNPKIDDFILVSPDAGASKKIYKLAEQIGYKGDIITCSKDRDTNGKLTKCVVPLTDRESHDFIIIDDICDGGATFINIAKNIKEQYKGLEDISPIKIYLVVTHGIFSKGFEELSKYFDGIYCTNSYRDIDDKFKEAFEHHNGKHSGVNIINQLNVF